MTARARGGTRPAHEEVERVVALLREANERLVVAALRALNESDESHDDAARARLELGALEEEYRNLSTRMQSLQDDERRRLAVDLHDSTAQCLAALAMDLDVIEGSRAGLDARARRALAECRALADRCLREVRTFAYVLCPPLLDDRGLPAALRGFVVGFTNRSGIPVTLHLEDIGRLPRPIEIALFSVVQESLTNIHRHAAGSTASIDLTRTVDAVALDIHDYGSGRRGPARAGRRCARPEGPGVGIQGMRERIRQLGGSFEIAFTDTGTTVRVRMPMQGGPS